MLHKQPFHWHLNWRYLCDFKLEICDLQEKYAPACLAGKDADFSSGQTGWVGFFSYFFLIFLFLGFSFRFMVGELLQRMGLT